MGWGRGLSTNCESYLPSQAQWGGRATQGLIPDILQEAEKQGNVVQRCKGSLFQAAAPDPSKLTVCSKPDVQAGRKKKIGIFMTHRQKFHMGFSRSQVLPPSSSVPRPQTFPCSCLLPHLDPSPSPRSPSHSEIQENRTEAWARAPCRCPDGTPWNRFLL